MSTVSISKTMTNGGRLVPGFGSHADSARHLDCSHSVQPIGPVADSLGNPLNDTQYPAHVARCQSLNQQMAPYDTFTYLERDQAVTAYMREGEKGNQFGQDYFEGVASANMQHNVGLHQPLVMKMEPGHPQGQLDSFLSAGIGTVFHQ